MPYENYEHKHIYDLDYIQQLPAAKFLLWLNWIGNHPYEVMLNRPSKWLYECWCPGGHTHERFPNDFLGKTATAYASATETSYGRRLGFRTALSSNLRIKYENEILAGIERYPRDETISLLSIGSGGLFQDFLMLIYIYRRGFKSITLDSIEIKDNKDQRELLAAIIAVWNRILPGTAISFNAGSRFDDEVTSLDVDQYEETALSLLGRTYTHTSNAYKEYTKIMTGRRLEPREYHVVYAIDIDELQSLPGKNFSTRFSASTEGDKKIKYDSHYYLSTLLIKAYARALPSSLFLASFIRNVITFQDTVDRSNFWYVTPFTTHIPPSHHYDYYYINNNIYCLLIHFAFLKGRNSSLLINRSLLDDTTYEAVKTLLDKHELNYYIETEANIIDKLKCEKKTVLIIDDTICNHPIDIEKSPFYQKFSGILYQISRLDHTRNQQLIARRQNHGIDVSIPVMLHPRYVDLKKAQFNLNWHHLSEERKVEMIQRSIEDFLTWQRTAHHRLSLITKFFYACCYSTYTQYATDLKADLEGSDTALGMLPGYLQQRFAHENAHDQHALSRFLFAAVTGDSSIFELDGTDYSQIVQHAFGLYQAETLAPSTEVRLTPYASQ